MKKNSNQQGREGEENILSYILELLPVLGFTPLKKRRQTSGSQQGKDFQFQWSDGNDVYTWHFEIKSQKREQISKGAVLEKLDDVKRSDHKIDCWCLVGIHKDPANELDDAIASWNTLQEYPFKIVTWSPQTFLEEQIYSVSPHLHEKIYGTPTTKVSEVNLDEFKKQISRESQQGRDIRNNFPSDLEKSILNSKDKPADILQVLNKTFNASKDHSDFTVEELVIKQDSTTASLKPREGKEVRVQATFVLPPDKQKEFEEFTNYERTEIDLDESQVQVFRAIVGETDLTQGTHGKRLKLSHVKPDFPPVNFYSADRGYIGLRNVDLKVRSMSKSALLMDNIDANAPVIVQMELGENSIKFPKVHANRESKEYEIEHELSTLDFWEDLIGNKSITMEDARTGKRLAEGNFVFENIDTGATLDAIHDYLYILRMIRDIRDFAGKKLMVPTKITKEQFNDISRIHKAITKKEIKVLLHGSSFTVAESEEIDAIEEGVMEEFATQIDPYVETLFGTEINLGEVAMEHHHMRVIKARRDGEVTVVLIPGNDKAYSKFYFKSI